MVTIHGNVFFSMELLWTNLRKFFYNHKTLFEILFLLVYFIEQLTLFLLILTKPHFAHFFAGIFTLLLITTISFEKICMQSRYTLLEEKINNQDLEKIKMMIKYKMLEKKYKKLRGELNP